MQIIISLEIDYFHSQWTQKYLHSRTEYSGWLRYWALPYVLVLSETQVYDNNPSILHVPKMLASLATKSKGYCMHVFLVHKTWQTSKSKLGDKTATYTVER